MSKLKYLTPSFNFTRLRHQGKNSDYVYSVLILISLATMGFSLIASSPAEIYIGMVRIINEPDRLITDYIKVAGMGGAFFNSGIMMLIACLTLRVLHMPFTGISISCVFLFGGFSLFGKNPVNILPIIFGTVLYSLYKGESIKKYIYVGLLATTLSPIITELHIMARELGIVWDRIFPIVGGIAIGFVLPSLAAYTLRVHQGYNLYNVGFAAGLLGIVLASMLKSMGNDYESRFIWSSGNNLLLGCYIACLCLLLIIMGVVSGVRKPSDYWEITRHSGRAIADFIILDGVGRTLVNMGLVGLLIMGVILGLKGQLNGPTLGGIFSAIGFASFGKHVKNIIWPMLGVAIASCLSTFSLGDPYVLLAMIFSTGLAPVGGHFGWQWGIIAGMMHSWVVLNIGSIHGGLNLYNNGFSAGLVCLVLVPIIQSLGREKDE